MSSRNYVHELVHCRRGESWLANIIFRYFISTVTFSQATTSHILAIYIASCSHASNFSFELRLVCTTTNEF